MDQPVVYRFPGTELRLEQDQISVRADGTLLLESVLRVGRIFREMQEQYGRFFLLVDLSKAGGMPAEVRRRMVAEVGATPPAAAAFFGGGMAARAMNALVAGALSMVTGRRQNFSYFGSREEALAWLAAERRRLGAA